MSVAIVFLALPVFSLAIFLFVVFCEWVNTPRQSFIDTYKSMTCDEDGRRA